MANKSTSNRSRVKKAGSKSAPEPERSASSIGYMIWIIPIIAIVIFGLMIYVWLEDGLMGMSIEEWRNIAILGFIILIVILVMVLSVKPETTRKPSTVGTRKEPKPVKAAESKPTKMVVIEAVEAEKAGTEDAAEISAAPAEATAPVEAAAAAAATEGELEIADAEIIAPPAKKVTPSIIEYPKKIEGGIYGDTFITVSDGETLKLRTLVVEDVYLV